MDEYDAWKGKIEDFIQRNSKTLLTTIQGIDFDKLREKSFDPQFYDCYIPGEREYV